ncbi:uncharacterized protein EV154DRAFT_547579 [Mucor mucedo]|uniref:uncharacterized protein n=1 Tax=Mucor mucedo TaxID=29922 RepID=UPI00222021A7|nr:uncharacterized protein EV154DRAFT_547579 [Mucor mucedo]KAI7896249.1 hypothetical protein EV154DRAFT_547579 [Mucor mucedo]
MMENSNRSALSVCRAFASQNHMSKYRGWGSLNGTEQWTMLKSMQEEVVEIDPKRRITKENTKAKQKQNIPRKKMEKQAGRLQKISKVVAGDDAKKCKRCTEAGVYNEE